MCGIYGFIGKPSKITPVVIGSLATLNIERGSHSAGVAFITKKEHKIIKLGEHPMKLYSKPEFLEKLWSITDDDFAIILGHTRYATCGDICDKNAHPFKIGNYIMTHNGVLTNFKELQAEYKTKYEVDSQIAGHALSKEPTNKEAFEKIQGSFAIPYVNTKEPEILRVGIHNQVYNTAELGNQLYYSSEAEHLVDALSGIGDDFVHKGSTNNYILSYKLKNNKIITSEEDFIGCVPTYNNFGQTNNGYKVWLAKEGQTRESYQYHFSGLCKDNNCLKTPCIKRRMSDGETLRYTGKKHKPKKCKDDFCEQPRCLKYKYGSSDTDLTQLKNRQQEMLEAEIENEIENELVINPDLTLEEEIDMMQSQIGELQVEQEKKEQLMRTYNRQTDKYRNAKQELDIITQAILDVKRSQRRLMQKWESIELKKEKQENKRAQYAKNQCFDLSAGDYIALKQYNKQNELFYITSKTEAGLNVKKTLDDGSIIHQTIPYRYIESVKKTLDLTQTLDARQERTKRLVRTFKGKNVKQVASYAFTTKN